MTITTEEAEARCQELLDCWHGQPATIQWPYRVLHDAVGTIRTLAAERDKLSKAPAGALANLADASRARGEAEGKLAASEMAGVVEGWKARAELAEAEAERLREALIETTDICHQCLFEYILIKGRYVYRKEAVARARAALEGGVNEKAPDR